MENEEVHLGAGGGAAGDGGADDGHDWLASGGEPFPVRSPHCNPRGTP
jgi:hypothetical protein